MSHFWKSANISMPALGTKDLVWDAQPRFIILQSPNSSKEEFSNTSVQSIWKKIVNSKEEKAPDPLFLLFWWHGVRELPLLLDFPTLLCFLCFNPPRCSHFTHEATLLNAYVLTQSFLKKNKDKRFSSCSHHSFAQFSWEHMENTFSCSCTKMFFSQQYRGAVTWRRDMEKVGFIPFLTSFLCR